MGGGWQRWVFAGLVAASTVVVTGVALLAFLVWSPWADRDADRGPQRAVICADCRSGVSDEVEPATARGLTAALLRDLESMPEASSVAGSSSDGVVTALVHLTGDPASSFYVSATSPDSSASAASSGIRPRCGQDSGYTTVVCTRVDGSLIEVSQGPEGSERGVLPLVIGRAHRADGSEVLLEIHVSGKVDFPGAFARILLEDPYLGWQTSVDLNAAGEQLEDFTDLDVVGTLIDTHAKSRG